MKNFQNNLCKHFIFKKNVRKENLLFVHKRAHLICRHSLIDERRALHVETLY